MVVLKLLCVLMLIILVVCTWKSVEYFNTLPETNKYKPLLAWDIIILMITAVVTTTVVMMI